MGGQTLLAVDDDPGLRLLAEAAFRAEGLQVALAATGEEALEVLSGPGAQPSVILLDILMPGIDGFETCRRIRDLPGHGNTPIVMLTGIDDVSAVERAYEAGAWDFTSKPINWPILKYRVRYALRASLAFESERRAARLSRTIDNSHSEVITFDAELGSVISANNSALDNLGYRESELVGQPFYSIAHGVGGRRLQEQLAALREVGQLNTSLALLRRDGTRYPADGVFLYSQEEEPSVVIGILQDTTERQRIEAELHRLAHYDELTQLPNRRLLDEHVRHALGRAARGGTRCAICMLDLDGFKRVNDTLGHSAGDLLLREVATRLSAVVRQHDCVSREPPLTPDARCGQLARLGGDEFFLLLTEFTDESAAARVAQRVLEQVARPYDISDTTLTVTASIGIALFPEDGTTLDRLMMHADAAMYRAKHNGKNTYAYYTPETGVNSLARLSLEAELREAIEREQLELHYQPQLDDGLRAVVGVEALIRWRHPVDGLRSPGTFIAIAEETGLIAAIGDFVLQRALQDIVAWQPTLGTEFKMSVNVSALQLRQEGFVDRVRGLLAQYPTARDRLVLEITESAIMSDADAALQWMQALKGAGARIAIDDFGTGYSSLSYLTRFPIDYLKVDQSFVSELEHGAEGAAVTRAVFRMAQELGIAIVTEGVETAPQLHMIRDMGRCLVQGWLVSPALPATELLEFVQRYDGGSVEP